VAQTRQSQKLAADDAGETCVLFYGSGTELRRNPFCDHEKITPTLAE
jgi:hypothetical protein